MISLKRFYYLSLLLPLIFPFVLANVLHVEGGDEVKNMDSIGWFAIGLIGTPPYLIFLIFAIRWMRKKTAKTISHAMWKWPLYILPFVVVLSVYFTNSGTFWASFSNRLIFMVEATALCLVYGYFYVVLTKALAWLFIKCRIIKPEAHEQIAQG